jgi:hypothetical protein
LYGEFTSLKEDTPTPVSRHQGMVKTSCKNSISSENGCVLAANGRWVAVGMSGWARTLYFLMRKYEKTQYYPFLLSLKEYCSLGA